MKLTKYKSLQKALLVPQSACELSHLINNTLIKAVAEGFNTNILSDEISKAFGKGSSNLYNYFEAFNKHTSDSSFAIDHLG